MRVRKGCFKVIPASPAGRKQLRKWPKHLCKYHQLQRKGAEVYAERLSPPAFPKEIQQTPKPNKIHPKQLAEKRAFNSSDLAPPPKNNAQPSHPNHHHEEKFYLFQGLPSTKFQSDSSETQVKNR